jgi:hypothetical protein
MGVRRSTIRAWAFGLLAFLALAIGAYALVMYGTPDHLHKQPFVTGKGSLPDLWYNILWAHAISAGIALAIGWLQFIKKLRHHAPNIHRLIGYMYSTMITIGGLTGLYLAFYANGGWFAQVGFGSLSVLWLYTLFRSLKSIIVDRDKADHGRWMIRNYALSCAAISLRIYTALAAVFLGLTDTNDTFFVIAWICWIPNLLLAELIIGEKKRTTGRTLVR